MSNMWFIAGNNKDDVSSVSRNDAEESVDRRSSKRRNTLQIFKEDENGEVCPMIILKDKDEPIEEAKPIGGVIGFSGEGTDQRNHYQAVDFKGKTYELEDTVLLVPDSEEPMKPYVAIIKDINEMKNGSIMLYVYWFYRPEDVEIENAESSDTRELFYSFHQDEVPAGSIFHKCIVHFVPLDRQIPNYRVHPGFVVQKVYNHISKKLLKLVDKNHEDSFQHEVDMLVQKTMCRLGDLPYIKSGDVNRENETSNRSDQLRSTEAPESCKSGASEYYIMLENSNAFTDNHCRDKWLEKLLEGIGFVCNNNDGSWSGVPTNMSEDNNPNTAPTVWPDAAVSAAIALEKATYASFSSEWKYNQKMRQLCYNMKKNAKLTWRLLKRELEPSKLLTMSPNELKEGLTAEEMAREKPEEDVLVQMTDARCQRCTEKKVCQVAIFLAGEENRYKLECTVCGMTWYAARV